MVEIIKKGIKREDRRYGGTCVYCKTEFTFVRSEAKYWSDCRNEEGPFVAAS